MRSLGLRTTGGPKFDPIIDFDQVVRDSSSADLIDPAYICDGIHPTPHRYYEMGNSLTIE